MVARSDADARKTALWTSLDALGRSRPHLLIEGEVPDTYIARWRGSPVPAYVLAGRLRRALPGWKLLTVSSFAGRTVAGGATSHGRGATRHHVTIVLAAEAESSESSEESKPCAEG